VYIIFRCQQVLQKSLPICFGLRSWLNLNLIEALLERAVVWKVETEGCKLGAGSWELGGMAL